MDDQRLNGDNGNFEATPGDGLIPARIIAIHRELSTARCALGDVRAMPTGAFSRELDAQGDVLAVGDRVQLKYNASGVSGIAQLMPRTSAFSRADPSNRNRAQVVAANFDDVFILCALDEDFSLNRIARYVAQAWSSGGRPVVILTKADLNADAMARVLAVESAVPGVPVIAVSSATGEGLERLKPYLTAGRTAVLMGSSGVGKSTLVNALAGADIMATAAIREKDGMGRHTTTHRQMIDLPCGMMLIDTPGMREIGLWDAEAGVDLAFSDVTELFARCRFRDCGHEKEPGCAVQAALHDGALSPARWEAYQAQQREAAYSADRAAYLRMVRDRAKGWHKLMNPSKRTGR